MVSMATWEAFAKGPPAGVLFFKGEAAGSRLVEVIESGDMPRGGGKLSDTEFTTLKTWISEGAVFDGSDPKAPLTGLAPSAKPEVAPTPTVSPATGKDSVSFAREVAPVLAKNCTGCQGTNRPRAMFNMNVYRTAQGGTARRLCPASRPTVLIKSSKEPRRQAYSCSPRWPTGLPRSKGSPKGPSTTRIKTLPLSPLQRGPPLRRNFGRPPLLANIWRLGMPDRRTKSREKNFHFWAASARRRSRYGEQAEAVVPKVAALFHASTDQPLVKGKITLYFFEQRYDYSEFGQMVERREIPKEWRGHWRNNIVDAYGALIPAKGTDYTNDVLLAQQVAGAYVASLGRGTPRWFPEGAARMAAAKLGPTDSRVAAWDAQLPEVLASMSKPDDFLNGKLPPEAADICSYSYVRHLMTDAKKFNGLLESLKRAKT
jgi:hypothetical protein